MTRVSVILLTAMLAPAVAAQHDRQTDTSVSDDQQIGTVAFGADCVDDAQQAFDHALGLMHHMMYVQARDEFDAIAQAHPDCAMAHWGVATTLFQPLWATTPSDAKIARGREAIEQARATEDSAAESIREAAFDQHPHQGTFPGAFHLAAIPARLAVEQRDWADRLLEIAPDAERDSIDPIKTLAQRD